MDINSILKKSGRSADEVPICHIQRLSELRRYEIAARYGHYLEHARRELGIATGDNHVAHFLQIEGWDQFWTDVNNDINKEKDMWMRYRMHDPTISGDDVKTTNAVFQACLYLKIDFDRCLRIISKYTNGDDLIHQPVERYFQQGQTCRLVENLTQDLRDVCKVTPTHLAGSVPFLCEIIDTVGDLIYGCYRHIGPIKPGFWTDEEGYLVVTELMDENKEKQKELFLDLRRCIEVLSAERCNRMIR